MTSSPFNDDGALEHLKGVMLPSISLPSTSGSIIDVSKLSGTTVLFGYPKNGNPQAPPNPKEYYDVCGIGVKGCTSQAQSFRDASDELLSYGVSHVFGLSTQDSEYQRELKGRANLPYEFLSDENLGMVRALNLPVHEFEDKSFIKRFNMVIEDGKVAKVFYPVPEPAASASLIVEWLKTRPPREILATEAENETMRNLQKR